jgi:hypothetical protein
MVIFATCMAACLSGAAAAREPSRKKASTGLQQGFNDHSRRAGGRFAARPFWPFCAFCVGKLNK